MLPAAQPCSIPAAQSVTQDTLKEKGVGILALGKRRMGMKAKLLSKMDGFFQLLGHASCTGDRNFIIILLNYIFTPKMKEWPQFTLLVLNSLHKPLDQLCDQREIQITAFLIFLDGQILPKNIFPPHPPPDLIFCHTPKMIISIHPQHPTPAGAHSLSQGGGLRLVAVPDPSQIWQREEGLHAPRTKEAQHHSSSTLLCLNRGSSPRTAVM